MAGLPNVQANNEQILNDIQALQEMEQQLFNSLESNPSLTSEQQQTIIEKMNQLSTMRINLYGTLSGINNYYQSALDTSTGTLNEQTVAIGIVESELNQAKERLSLLEQEKNNKIRLVEINTYFGDKYAEHSQLMKIIIFTLIPIIIISLLYTKGILPNKIYLVLVIIVSIIGGYFFWKRFASIIMRDNMNYQEYNFPSIPSSSNPGSSSDPWFTNANLGTCVGEFCCSPGLVYDSSFNKCIIGTLGSGSSSGLSNFSSTQSGASGSMSGTSNNTSGSKSNFESFITESMINSVLTKKQQGKYKSDYNLRSPQPSNS
jgi:hypothetical protein